jgi:hypothetical protein
MADRAKKLIKTQKHFKENKNETLDDNCGSAGSSVYFISRRRSGRACPGLLSE